MIEWHTLSPQEIERRAETRVRHPSPDPLALGEARLQESEERYRRLFADNESRARDAAAQAEANFLAARTALGNP